MGEDALTGEKTARYNTLRDYILVVFRHKWKALFFCLFVWTLTIVLTNLMKDNYRSEAKILVRIGWESVNVDPTATTAETAGRISERAGGIIPPAVLLQPLYIGEIERVRKDPRRVEPTHAIPDPLVDDSVVFSRRFPTHTTQKADHSH